MPRVLPGAVGGVALGAFDQFVVKLHSRCNLACDYCYIYELRDTGWRGRPQTMPAAVREQLVLRIAEHVSRHRLPVARVILHGGEPLLAGADVIAGFARSVRRAVGDAGGRVQLVMQSNGLLVDEALLDVLLRHDIHMGVSLDGDREAQDRHRHRRRRPDAPVTARTSSWSGTRQALALLELPRYRGLFDGLLCAVDTANDPVRTYDALVAHRPPAIDFLLPQATWDHPAPGGGGTDAPYGDWLAAVFDRWWRDGRPVRVRLFDAIIALCLTGGASGGSESVGALPAAAVVVESDGTIGWTDSLKAVADGAADSHSDVFGHSFDAVLALPEAPEYGPQTLCDACRQCPVVGICGGGTRAHRHGRGRGFANPSVYCGDLFTLIGHIRARLGN